MNLAWNLEALGRIVNIAHCEIVSRRQTTHVPPFKYFSPQAMCDTTWGRSTCCLRLQYLLSYHTATSKKYLYPYHIVHSSLHAIVLATTSKRPTPCMQADQSRCCSKLVGKNVSQYCYFPCGANTLRDPDACNNIIDRDIVPYLV